MDQDVAALPVIQTDYLDAALVKLTGLWENSAEAWFRQAEAQFAGAGITSEGTKFERVLVALNEEQCNRVLDYITQPTAGKEYSNLKSALLAKYKKSPMENARPLLFFLHIGSLLPSGFLISVHDTIC
ncbi:hypothetical protein TCAL_17076 [Tigriopus californicus]|uniref:DUF7041 domain-containing protein n=1 Tax=Tigriopus californicus TaxID=6832 RepID=A0A553PQ94_TIGCA|nr:hypothetical protein TCAL_17076 [Tigriopus californicus]